MPWDPSAAVFKWAPIFNIGQGHRTEWQTLVSTSESGVEQRRQRWSSPRKRLILRFDTHVHNTENEILAFFNARQGSFEAFYIPSFRRETELTVAYSGGTTLNVANTDEFNNTEDAHGYYVAVRSGRNVAEVRFVTNPPTSSTLTINSAFSNTYGVGSPVDVAYYVRFSDDNLSEDNVSYFLYTVGIQFVEIKQ